MLLDLGFTVAALAPLPGDIPIAESAAEHNLFSSWGCRVHRSSFLSVLDPLSGGTTVCLSAHLLKPLGILASGKED